jgi:hypothetical protein
MHRLIHVPSNTSSLASLILASISSARYTTGPRRGAHLLAEQAVTASRRSLALWLVYTIRRSQRSAGLLYEDARRSLQLECQSAGLASVPEAVLHAFATIRAVQHVCLKIG